MIPKRMVISNFKSFVAPQVFDFGESPGLFFLTGRNEAEPRLGANGVGKSSVWDALCWVCYGTSIKGLRAGDVANWEVGKKSRVDLVYSWEEEEYTVSRTWSPNSWTLLLPSGETQDLTKGDENLFLRHLGLTFEAFKNCVLMGQSQPMFLDMSASSKATLFSQVLGLDSWLEYSTRASKAASVWSGKLQEAQREESQTQGTLLTLQSTDYQEDIKNWKQENLKQVQQLQNDFEVAQKDLQRESREAESFPKRIQIARGKLEESQAASREIDLELQAQKNARLEETTVPLRMLQKSIEQLTASLEDSGPKRCRACGQVISSGSAADHKQELQAQIEKETTQLRILEARNAELLEFEKVLQGRASVLTASWQEDQRALASLQSAARDATNVARQTESRLTRIQEQLRTLTTAECPFEKKQEELLQKITTAENLLADLHTKVDTTTERVALYSYWVRGFKEVRLFLIAESLEQLEIEVNSALMSLGLEEWSIKFDVDKETKSGTLQKGFSVLVQSPTTEKYVPWEAWSGGESQRLRLAAQMGLANLIRTYTGAAINLEVWDEPTDALSEGGVLDLLENLASRSVAEDRRVWVIDHRTPNFGGFSNVVTVVKQEDGSKIENN